MEGNMGYSSQLGYAPLNTDYTRNISFLIGEIAYSKHAKSRAVLPGVAF